MVTLPGAQVPTKLWLASSVCRKCQVQARELVLCFRPFSAVTGEKPLDTREMENTGDTLMVLSPVSAVQLNGDHFLASISAHGRLQEMTSATVPPSGESRVPGMAGHLSSSLATRMSLPGRGAHLEGKMLPPFGSFTEASSSSDTFFASSSSFRGTGEEAALSDLPREFSWSDPFNQATFDEEVINQGNCGSCYAVAATYALQKRFEIAASRMLGRKIRLFGRTAGPVSADATDDYLNLSFLGVDEASTVGSGTLSAQSVLSCSFYNQGCDGGFPYLVGKHARDIGEACLRAAVLHLA